MPGGAQGIVIVRSSKRLCQRVVRESIFPSEHSINGTEHPKTPIACSKFLAPRTGGTFGPIGTMGTFGPIATMGACGPIATMGTCGPIATIAARSHWNDRPLRSQLFDHPRVFDHCRGPISKGAHTFAKPSG